MPTTPSLQVFILSHNRWKFLLETIKSFEEQEYADFELIVSDNSTDEATRKSLQGCRHKVIFREPGIDVFQHYNEVLKEVSTPYFMIFHDDDLLEKDALGKMMAKFEDKKVVGVSCNAQILQGEQRTSGPFNIGLVANKIIHSPEEMARFYVRGHKYINPFSSYIYRHEVKKLTFGYGGLGKYSDVAFLVHVTRLGSVLWMKEPLMLYRFHENNDSGKVDYKALRSLCDYLMEEGNLPKVEVEDFYHSVNLMRSLRQKDLKGICSSSCFYAFHPSMFYERFKAKIQVKKIR